MDNFWNKPTYKKPYYYIHNVNSVRDTENSGTITRATNPTNPYNSTTKKGTDVSLLSTSHTIDGTTVSYGSDANGKTIV